VEQLLSPILNMTSLAHVRAITMASGINIYSQLLISLIRIVDISNSNCWYQQL